MRLTLTNTMTHRNVSDGSSDTTSVSDQLTLDLRETMRTELKKLSKLILDSKEPSTAYLSGISRQSIGLMNTTSMNTQHQRLLITMVYLTLTFLAVVTTVLLCLVCTMLTGYLLTGIIAALVGIAISVILSLKMLRTLTELSDLSLDVIKGQQKDGLDKPTESGGLVW